MDLYIKGFTKMFYCFNILKIQFSRECHIYQCFPFFHVRKVGERVKCKFKVLGVEEVLFLFRKVLHHLPRKVKNENAIGRVLKNQHRLLVRHRQKRKKRLKGRR